MEKTKFVTGRRYNMYRNVSILFNIIVIGVFYFIYNHIFIGEGAPPNIPLLIVFIIIAAITAYITNRIYKRLSKRYYKIEKDGLVFFNGRTEIKYYWNAFKEINYDTFKFTMVYPVRFVTSKGEFFLLHQIEGIPELIGIIVGKVKDSAKVDKEIYMRFGIKD